MAKSPSVNDISFWKTGAKNYKQGIRRELSNEMNIDKWTRKILENAPDGEKLRILDVGTGPGFFTITLTRLGHDVTGVDITPEMVQAAKDNAAEQGMECDFRQMDADDIDFPDGTFDLIINRNVTWTLPDMYECYREWRRVLVPGGRIIVFDSNYYANQFSEDKARLLRMQMRESALKGTVYNERHDFHIRWSYWEDRPMIGMGRPGWDANMLHKLRFTDIVTDNALFMESYEDNGSCTSMFMIRATKPDKVSESKFILGEYYDGISGVYSAYTRKSLDSGSVPELLEKVPCDASCGRVLDVGTGSGLVAIALSGKCAGVIGIDTSEPMIEMARITAEECESSAKFKVMDAEHLDFGDSEFDVVVMRNLLSFIQDPEQIISEASRVLSPGGFLCIIDAPWITRIDAWRDSAEDCSVFPDYLQRDWGYGCKDVVDRYLRKLPMADPKHNLWDARSYAGFGLEPVYSGTAKDSVVAEFYCALGDAKIMVLKKAA